MLRARQSFKKGLPIAAGVAAGVLLASLLGAGTATVAEAAAQDPAVSLQIQTAMNNFQIQMQNRFNLMQNEINTLQRQVQDLRFTLQTAGVMRQGGSVPIEGDTIGIAGTPRIEVPSQVSESQLFMLRGTGGRPAAQIATTSDGPGLVLFDANGNITAALLSTPNGPELRMVDADGNLRTVLSGRQ